MKNDNDEWERTETTIGSRTHVRERPVKVRG